MARRKRVLLVNTNTETAPYPVAPLGLCLVAASLDGRYEVRLLNGTFDERNRVAEIAESFDPDYLGVGIRNIDDVVMDNEAYYLDAIKAEFVDPLKGTTAAPMILGGAGYSLFPREILDLFDADFGVVGAGETAFPALLSALDEGRDPAGLPGVIARGGTGPALDPVPKPGGLAVPFSRIDTFTDFGPYRRRGSYPIQTKRGCPLHCLYCVYPRIEGRRHSLRPPGDVADEIEDTVGRLGDVIFEVVDSTFNHPADHMEAVCREIVQRGLSVKLRTMGVNPGGLDENLLDWMKRAGFVQIDCTPDTASERMLESLRKGFGRAQLENAATAIAKIDMPTMWFFVFGGPGESEETVAETIDFIDRFVQTEDMVHMSIGLRVLPGSGIHEVAVKEGVLAPDESLLRSKYYVAPGIGLARLRELIESAASKRLNCIPSSESTPPPEMLKEAMILREKEGLTEPMFRTLLRIRRRDWGKTGSSS